MINTDREIQVLPYQVNYWWVANYKRSTAFLGTFQLSRTVSTFWRINIGGRIKRSDWLWLQPRKPWVYPQPPKTSKLHLGLISFTDGNQHICLFSREILSMPFLGIKRDIMAYLEICTVDNQLQIFKLLHFKITDQSNSVKKVSFFIIEKWHMKSRNDG